MNRKIWRLINPILYALFWIGYGAAFWGAFEFAFKLAERGIIESAVWSGTFGFPFFHHYIYGFIMVGVAWVLIPLIQFLIKNGKE